MELLVDDIISERLAEAEREQLVFQVPRAETLVDVTFFPLIGSALRTSANLCRRTAPCERIGGPLTCSQPCLSWTCLLALDVLAIRFGYGSRDGFHSIDTDGREPWPRRE